MDRRVRSIWSVLGRRLITKDIPGFNTNVD